MSTQPDQFTDAQLAKLRTDYGRIESVDPCEPTYDKMRALLKNMSDAPLLQLARTDIKFLSRLARNACVRRGLEWEA